MEEDAEENEEENEDEDVAIEGGAEVSTSAMGGS